MDVTAIVFAAIAVVVTGIALFFWKKTASAKNETTLANVKTAQLQEDKENLTADLASERNELARVRAESAARAGFESLATERERTITGLSGELDRLREELKAKSDETRTQGESIKILETELENERKNLVEKLALLEGAKQTLSNHFQTLAGDILETKSKTFSDTNKTEIGTLLNPLREQIRDFREKVENVQTENLVGRTELSAKLEQLKDLNERLSTEAQALTNALTRDTSEQGHWGELVLLDILEACDLKRGLHYT